MRTLIAEIESSSKAREISSILFSVNFVRKLSSVSKLKAIIALLQEHENMKKVIVKKKNIATARYL